MRQFVVCVFNGLLIINGQWARNCKQKTSFWVLDVEHLLQAGWNGLLFQWLVLLRGWLRSWHQYE
jgi:hypothetical protein